MAAQKYFGLRSSVVLIFVFQVLQIIPVEIVGTEMECKNPRSSDFIKWVYYQGFCYTLYKDSLFTYDQAKEFCKRNDAVLASIHSSHETDFIVGMVPADSSNFWIGLYRQFDYDRYQWEDGTPLDYRNWHADFIDYDNDDEDYDDINRCVIFAGTATENIEPGSGGEVPKLEGFWFKRPCEDRNIAICKYKYHTEDAVSSGPYTEDALTPGPTEDNQPGFCPDGWYTFEEKCYKIFEPEPPSKGISWSDADGRCRLIRSYLVTIHNVEEQEFLKYLLLDLRSDTWIGLRRFDHSEIFYWPDTSSLDFTNWNRGEPSNLHHKENCVHMFYRYEHLGKWNDALCDSKLPYICKRSKDPELTKPGLDPTLCANPEGWLKLRTSCFKVFHEDTKYASWLQAQSQCKSHAGNLASVKNDGETMYLRRHLTKLEGPFWIGIKSTRKHKYAWLGKHHLVYSNWQTDQPKEVSDQRNCVATDNEGRWMVKDCDESHPFICEVREDVTDPTIAPYHPNMTCPDSSRHWHDFGGNYCYIIEINKQLKWHEASCQCSKNGGFLASFHSIHEITVIQHHVKGHGMPLHIGFERDRKGIFVWSDGSATDFTNWNSGEPSDPKEQCTEMHTTTGKWNDIHCAVEYGYVCSTHKVPESIKSESGGASAELEGKETHLGAGSIALITISAVAVVAISLGLIYYFVPSVRTKLPYKMSYSELNQ